MGAAQSSRAHTVEATPEKAVPLELSQYRQQSCPNPVVEDYHEEGQTEANEAGTVSCHLNYIITTSEAKCEIENKKVVD